MVSSCVPQSMIFGLLEPFVVASLGDETTASSAPTHSQPANVNSKETKGVDERDPRWTSQARAQRGSQEDMVWVLMSTYNMWPWGITRKLRGMGPVVLKQKCPPWLI
jgi:hypothetical protein